jgi:hypothetical protein
VHKLWPRWTSTTYRSRHLFEWGPLVAILCWMFMTNFYLLNIMMPKQIRYYGNFHISKVLTLQSHLTRDLTRNCLAKKIALDKTPSNSTKDPLLQGCYITRNFHLHATSKMENYHFCGLKNKIKFTFKLLFNEGVSLVTNGHLNIVRNIYIIKYTHLKNSHNNVYFCQVFQA